MDETFVLREDCEVVMNVIPQHNDHVCGDVSINKPITNQLLERKIQTYIRDIHLIIKNSAAALLFTILDFYHYL